MGEKVFTGGDEADRETKDHNMSAALQIAKTIQSQIGSRRMMALGATKLRAVPGGVGHFGGLNFKASLFGSKQCRVTITLNAADTYDYMVLAARSDTVLALGKGLYCDNIGTEIELAVEKHFAR